MMDFITAPLVVGFICLGIYALFELFGKKAEPPFVWFASFFV